MHSAPAGPPPSARLLALLASAGHGLRSLRRTRLLTAVLGGLVIAALTLGDPLPAGGKAPASTAVLTSPSEGGRELVPATGDGWTQDGLPPAPESPVAAEPAPGAGTADGTASVAAEEAPPSPAAGASAPSETAPDAASPAGTPAPARSASAGPGKIAPEAPPTPARATTSRASDEGTPSSPSPSPSPSVPSAAVVVATTADQVLAAVDAARTAAGCEPLTADAGLTDAATAHSEEMSDSEDREPPPGPGAVAEGLTDPAAVAAGWLADPAVPLTDCTVTTAGVGVVDGWWTLLLA